MNLAPTHVLHLGKRLWGSLQAAPLTDEERTWVQRFLLDDEYALWNAMAWRDQRHSFQVAQRFAAIAAQSSSHGAPQRDAMAAALLHDVGKSAAPLSTGERVAVTIIGGRTARFRAYLNHEAIGHDLCQQAGSTALTLDLLAGRGDPLLVQQLRQADEI